MKSFGVFFVLVTMTEVLADEEDDMMTCGVRKFNPHAKIVGGSAAKLGEFPWYVLITNRRNTHCGGVIIDAYHVLSAAHCFSSSHCYTASSRDDFLRVLRSLGADHYPGVEELQPCKYVKIKKMALVAGISQTMTNEERKSKQTRKIAAVYVSDQYISFTDTDNPALHNDLVVIRLKKPFQFTENVRPACLPDENMVLPTGQTLTVTGFGVVKEGGYASSRLQKASVNKFSDEQCDEFYSNVVSNSMICAGRREGGVDACQGDSGGPIGVDTAERFTVVGVVSWGYGCARKGKPGVYTDLTKFLPFIEQAKAKEIKPSIIK